MNAYETLTRKASILKLRAMRLAEIGDEHELWQAVVMFHDAARKELEARAYLDDGSLEAEAGARIEACGLLLDGRDPVGATEQWRRIPSEIMGTALGEAMLARLRPAFEREHAAFAAAWQKLNAPTTSPGSFRDVDEAQLCGLAEKYPGVAGLYWAIAYRARTRGDGARFKDALTRVCALEPRAPLRITTICFAMPPALDMRLIAIDPSVVDEAWASIDEAASLDIARSSSAGRDAIIAARLKDYPSTFIPRRSTADAPFFRKVA